MAYRILLVDDSLIVRRMMKKTLELTDIEISAVLEANNGKEGLDVLKKEWVDLVFLDINMPVMNGMEFMKVVREDPSLSLTPVIIVSTEGSKERQEQLFDMDVKAFIRKPVTPETLSETITNILGGKS